MDTKNSTWFFAGNWNTSRTLAKIELEFLPDFGLSGGYRIKKILKIYEGGVGMHEGMHLLSTEMKSALFEEYQDAQKQLVEDCYKRIQVLRGEIDAENRWMENLIGMDEHADKAPGSPGKYNNLIEALGDIE